MFKISDFSNGVYTIKFTELLKFKWDEIHSTEDVFRYKIDKLEQRIVDNKYFLQLNPDRQAKRRPPEEITSISQPFDRNKFNFTKISANEVLFILTDDDSGIHSVIVNVSPISRYHSLLCPSVNKCLPQVITAESLTLAINVMFLTEDQDLRILFNSLSGFASVNHLHYHLFFDNNDFYVESVKWHHLIGNIYQLDHNYPVPAFCFQVQKYGIEQTTQDIYKVIEYLIQRKTAHNILLTKRLCIDDTIKVLVWPRKSTEGAKQLDMLNVAVLELSGWFPVYDPESFKNLTAEDLEMALREWNIEDFDELCEEIKCLFL